MQLLVKQYMSSNAAELLAGLVLLLPDGWYWHSISYYCMYWLVRTYQPVQQ